MAESPVKNRNRLSGKPRIFHTILLCEILLVANFSVLVVTQNKLVLLISGI